MLHKTLLRDYFDNAGKIVIPEDKGCENTAMAAAVAANFADLGYVMPKEMIEKLGKADRDDIIAFNDAYFPHLKEQVGMDRHYRPFYPNFPEEVMDKHEIEFFLDQVIYALSGLQIKPDVYEEAIERFPFIGKGVRRPVLEGSEADYVATMQRTISAQRAWTPMQRDQVIGFIKKYPDCEFVLPPAKQVQNHENAVALTCILEDNHKKNANRYMVTATDVLRYAAVRSAQEDLKRGRGTIPEILMHTAKPEDMYKYAALTFTNKQRPSFKFGRKLRRSIASKMEMVAGKHDLAAEMMQKKSMWKWVIHNMHINEFDGFSKTKKAFAIISENRTVDRAERRIEEALKKKDLDTVIKEIRKRPGDLSKRFDHLLRLGIEQGKEEQVIALLRDTASRAGINAAMSLAGHIQSRAKEETARMFKSPKSMKVWKTEAKNRKPFPESIVKRAREVCMQALSDRFVGKPSMGKVFVSEEMKDYMVPTDMRNASKGMRNYTPGSKIAVHSDDKEFIRLFVSWTNLENKGYGNRLDIDLTGRLIFADGRSDVHVGWNGDYMVWKDQIQPPRSNREDGPLSDFMRRSEHSHGRSRSRRGHDSDDWVARYSGDVQDGGPIDGPGAAEYIDVNLKNARELGVKYVIMPINSFTHQNFAEQPNTACGFMFRSKEELGKDFEPKTVEERFKLQGEATAEIAGLYDVQEDKFIIIDRPLMSRVASQNVEEIKEIIDQLRGQFLLNLEELINANVEGSRSERTIDLTEADTIFIGSREYSEFLEKHPDFNAEDKTIIFPHDITYITGELMQGPQDKQVEHEVPEKAEMVSELYQEVGAEPDEHDLEEDWEADQSDNDDMSH